jgi:TctA family transporter
MGLPQMLDGFHVVVVAVGLFAVGETLFLATRPGGPGEIIKISGWTWMSREDLARSWKPWLRGALLGFPVGGLPTGGTEIPTFLSYAIERRLCRKPEEFGHGAIEGVAGPEAANNAAAQTSFIPMLTLGLPSSAVMALMIGALTVQGITPGPQLMEQRPDLFWGLVVSMWLGNFMLVILNLPLVGLWVNLFRIPTRFLYPGILMFCCVGVYSLNTSALDVFIATLFGLLGFVCHRLRCEPAPLLLGFVLGPMIEENLRRALLISHGDPRVFMERPISLSFLILSAVLLVMLVVPAVRKTREHAFQEGET